MALHQKKEVADQILDCVFASKDLSVALPKYKFPEHETLPDLAYQVIHDELLLDGNSRQNLATFCQTWEEPQVHALMDLSIDKNLEDKDEYPQTAEIERRCVHMMADLWQAHDAANTVGTSTIGSSEACMLAGMAAKWRWRARQEAAGKPSDQPNMVCGPVQVVWHKFARYWDVEMREIPMAPGNYCMDTEQMLDRVDENTIFVMPTFGVTYTGAYEPVAELALALDDLQERTGLDVDIHVDGASGGFLAPFCAPEVEFDFRIPRVKSISTSGHKFGLAPLGVGWVVWSDVGRAPRRADLPRQLPGWRHAGLPDQLLEAGRPDHRPVLRLHPAGPGRLRRHPQRMLRDGPVPGRRRSRNSGPSSCSVAAIRPRASRRSPGASGKAKIPDTRSSTWPTACATAAGRCPPTP